MKGFEGDTYNNSRDEEYQFYLKRQQLWMWNKMLHLHSTLKQFIP